MSSVIFSPPKTVPNSSYRINLQLGLWDYTSEESQGFLGFPFITPQTLVPRPSVNISSAVSAVDSIAARKLATARCHPKTQMGKV